MDYEYDRQRIGEGVSLATNIGLIEAVVIFQKFCYNIMVLRVSC